MVCGVDALQSIADSQPSYNGVFWLPYFGRIYMYHDYDRTVIEQPLLGGGGCSSRGTANEQWWWHTPKTSRLLSHYKSHHQDTIFGICMKTVSPALCMIRYRVPIPVPSFHHHEGRGWANIERLL